MRPKGVRVCPRSRDSIQTLADHFRLQLRFHDKPFFDVIKVFELALPVLVDDYNYEILPREEMGELHGRTYPERHCIQLREDVYNRATDGKGRDRFTVAHEIGHLLLHTDTSFARSNTATTWKRYEDSEWQADVFAGQLLAPTYLIKGMSPTQVCRECQVSLQAAKVQLDNLANIRRWEPRLADHSSHR